MATTDVVFSVTRNRRAYLLISWHLYNNYLLLSNIVYIGLWGFGGGLRYRLSFRCSGVMFSVKIPQMNYISSFFKPLPESSFECMNKGSKLTEISGFKARDTPQMLLSSSMERSHPWHCTMHTLLSTEKRTLSASRKGYFGNFIRCAVSISKNSHPFDHETILVDLLC